MRPRFMLPASALLLTLTAGAFAQSTQPAPLKVGDPAPPLTVGKWLKGEPVAKIEAGKIYVIDFWATWCVPCRLAMPHMTELAKKFPEVVVIAQNIWEDDPEAVKPFLDEMGDKIGYRVALDDLSKPGRGAMSAGWMEAMGRETIPTVVVVGKDSKIAWVGHPMELDEPLAKIVAGTFDAQAAATAKAREETLNKQMEAALKVKDVDGVLAATKELATLKPAAADALAVFEFNVLARNGRADAARVRADAVARTSKNVQALDTVAWTIALLPGMTPADYQIARVAVDRAGEIGGHKEPALFETSARLYAIEKDWTKATAAIQKAMALADGQAKAGLQKTLDAYNKQELPAVE